MIKNKAKFIRIFLIIATFVMIVLRFLWNEKGRVTPDSIRYMRQAKVFPEIDNTTAPLLYPLSIKILSFLSDEFWASKILGILCFLFIIFWSRKKDFFSDEILVVAALFSFVSIFAATLSEVLIFPFLFLLYYFSHQIFNENIKGFQRWIIISVLLIILYNIRYSSVFLSFGCIVFGLMSLKKNYGKVFILSGFVSILYVIFYQFLFIERFNENYIDTHLEIGLKPTSVLLTEFFYGICTSFNPFIHIANPSGGILNFGILGIGLSNILLIIFLILKNPLSEIEKLILSISLTGIVCTFAIQYFYSIDPIDFRLLSAFSFGIWLIEFNKLKNYFGSKIFVIGILSLISGFVFTWLTKADFLENQSKAKAYLQAENLENERINYYIPKNGDADLSSIQVAELLSTVNPRIYFTENPKDTLSEKVLTKHKIEQKLMINKNKFQ